MAGDYRVFKHLRRSVDGKRFMRFYRVLCGRGIKWE